MPSLTAKAPALASMVVTHFLGSFMGKLKLPTIAAHLPIFGNLAPMQSTAQVKSSALTVTEAIEKGAAVLADSVNSIAEAAGATHISFEQLEGMEYVRYHTATDNETGVSVRFMQGFDPDTPEQLSRFDVCYRLWKLLPSALPEGA